ncbi:MAG: thioredoxin domain-containing protein [Candidatus Doudnabacteria bacterium]|nr:thioredoxin domain-containing protein [Candidatus Doudnabacteria bacterium]
MQRKTIIIISLAAATIIIAGLLLFFSDQEDKAGSVKTESERTVSVDEVVSEDAHFKGQAGAPIVIVEFSDFQCPACRLEYPELKKLLAANPQLIQLYYRHLPLPQHNRAKPAAAAAEAAGLQGKFWEMHDLLFENQSKLDDDNIRDYAKKLSLDLKKFEEDWSSAPIKEKIERDLKKASELQLTSTPTVIINGKIFSQVLSFTELEKRIASLVTDSK